jgi:hypothetical protein
MKQLLVVVFATALLAGCGIARSRQTATAAPPHDRPEFLTEDEKHRLYTAALVASESPLESETFKAVCRTIGVFDAGGAPNDNYLLFVSAHVDWAMKNETEEFKQEIKTREKAREYVSKHLSAVSE